VAAIVNLLLGLENDGTYTLETLVFPWHLPITDQLDLWLMRYRLQVGVEDRSLFLASLVVTMTIADGCWVECLSSADVVSQYSHVSSHTAALA